MSRCVSLCVDCLVFKDYKDSTTYLCVYIVAVCGLSTASHVHGVSGDRVAI